MVIGAICLGHTTNVDVSAEYSEVAVIATTTEATAMTRVKANAVTVKSTVTTNDTAVSPVFFDFE